MKLLRKRRQSASVPAAPRIGVVDGEVLGPVEYLNALGDLAIEVRHVVARSRPGKRHQQWLFPAEIDATDAHQRLAAAVERVDEVISDVLYDDDYYRGR